MNPIDRDLRNKLLANKELNKNGVIKAMNEENVKSAYTHLGEWKDCIVGLDSLKQTGDHREK